LAHKYLLYFETRLYLYLEVLPHWKTYFVFFIFLVTTKRTTFKVIDGAK